MNPAVIVRFKPNGPWRIGAGGARDRVDRIFHSDALFSAVTAAMARLGALDEWLAATVAGPGGPEVRFSSCFPYLEQIHFVVPPRNLWPPPPSPKVRWRNARFVPLAVVKAIAAEQPLNDNAWYLDGASECLLPSAADFRSGPFRRALRSHAAVDRQVAGVIETHRTACLEFAEGGGLWAVAEFTDEAAEARWSGPVRAALRLLADSGLGGERSIGWGCSEPPEFIEGSLPDMILPPPQPPAPAPEPAEPEAEGAPPAPKPPPETAWWLLSLFTPARQDAVDWQRGIYGLTTRGGRVESPADSGAPKKLLRMVEEGSVLVCDGPPRGAASDVAPDGFPHPVYRAGFALAIPIPLRLGAS